MCVVSLKVGMIKQNFFAALRAPNNTNAPFQNPGSTTDEGELRNSRFLTVSVEAIVNLVDYYHT